MNAITEPNPANVPKDPLTEKREREREEFRAKTREALTEVFEAAKNASHGYFVLSLVPEFRGLQGPGWNTAQECFTAIHDYMDYLNRAPNSRIKIRIALAFYTHISEASGFYESLKNMLRVAEGKPHIIVPFKDLVDAHRLTGEAVAPNANKIFKDLIGHGKTLRFDKLADILTGLFDPDLRNGFAHADYVVWNDGIRLPKRNGGIGRLIDYDEFNRAVTKAVDFFDALGEVHRTYMESYNPPQTFTGINGGRQVTFTVTFQPGKEFKIQWI